MTDEELSTLASFSWARKRLPPRDALSMFAPDPCEPDPVIMAEMQQRTGECRVFQVQGGCRILFPFDGGAYDASQFAIEPKAWDHERCDVCLEPIPAMTPCYWADGRSSRLLICTACHQRYVKPKQRRRWWRFWE